MATALQHVAVVGAGAAGLCAARRILSRPDRFAPPVLFELSANVGGTWCYEERVGTYDDGRPILSSMYRHLRTNLPKEVMMFPDFPFEEQPSSFLPHQEVRRYLETYCDNYKISPHIRFSTVVEDVKAVVMTTGGEEEQTTWEVISSDGLGCRRTEMFDSVFVCTGHYSDPYIPDVAGLDKFKGQVLHSHAYRSADAFSGLSVVVLGARASGLDISLELANVTLSHGRPPLTFPLPAAIRQSSPVAAVEDDGRIRFQDGSLKEADALLFCTGYKFSFPFLDAQQLALDIQDHLVAPLYRFMMPPAFPSLFFIGICKTICPFPYFDCQVQFALSVLDGSVTLPSRAQMEDEVRQWQQEKVDCGVPLRHLMVMDKDQWEYLSMLAVDAGFPPLPPVVRSLYEEVWRQRQVHPENYRQVNYRLVSDTQWQLVDDAGTSSLMVATQGQQC
ncbi:flavin-containing monooxygenase 5 isoform X2 [Dunckerocampus dactyliophorus]|uniref:flavin-containing monooxygenase 5 isoform X2 n=1 Tax=Dunckerocampus dactyliophorus TaxID=161453 RepID=UPI002404CE12|nr:flavin-containing monooxygenase 5 isoform X2 [Dunckerocampus dactyliophorus]